MNTVNRPVVHSPAKASEKTALDNQLKGEKPDNLQAQIIVAKAVAYDKFVAMTSAQEEYMAARNQLIKLMESNA